MSDDELESASGYIYTHWDCPECQEVNEEEGDAGNDICECTACGAKFRVEMR